MFARLLLLFVAIPLTDLILLLILSRFTGVWITLGIVLLTGLVGAWIARKQWQWLLERSRSRIVRNELPAEVVTDGFMILIGAVLLITPGLLTDLVGFSLMLPRIRGWYRGIGKKWISERLRVMVPGQEVPQGSPEVVDSTARETRQEF